MIVAIIDFNLFMIHMLETNECIIDNDPCSGQNKLCIDLPHGFECKSCPAGFQFNTSSKDCSGKVIFYLLMTCDWYKAK